MRVFQKLSFRIFTIVALISALAFTSVRWVSGIIFTVAERSEAREAARSQIGSVVDMLELTYNSLQDRATRQMERLREAIDGLVKKSIANTEKALLNTQKIAEDAVIAAQLASAAQAGLNTIADIAESMDQSAKASMEIARLNRAQENTGHQLGNSVERITHHAKANAERAKKLLEEINALEKLAGSLGENAKKFIV